MVDIKETENELKKSFYNLIQYYDRTPRTPDEWEVISRLDLASLKAIFETAFVKYYF